MVMSDDLPLSSELSLFALSCSTKYGRQILPGLLSSRLFRQGVVGKFFKCGKIHSLL